MPEVGRPRTIQGEGYGEPRGRASSGSPEPQTESGRSGSRWQTSEVFVGDSPAAVPLPRLRTDARGRRRAHRCGLPRRRSSLLPALAPSLRPCPRAFHGKHAHNPCAGSASGNGSGGPPKEASQGTLVEVDVRRGEVRSECRRRCGCCRLRSHPLSPWAGSRRHRARRDGSAGPTSGHPDLRCLRRCCRRRPRAGC